MLRFHIRQNLRSAFFLVVLVALIAVPVALWHANRHGLPDSWRASIERELAGQGLHLEIGAIRYLPLRGIAASDVRVFADPGHQYELSRIGRILLDFDKTKLARGEVRLKKMQLANANVVLPADTSDPASEILELTQVNGTLLMPGGRVLEVRDAEAQIGGINVTFDARLLGYRSAGTGGLPQAETDPRGRRREFIATISREIARWSWPEDQRPQVRISMRGDLNHITGVSSSFSLEAPVMSLNNHPLHHVDIKGGLDGMLLSLESIHAEDERGRFIARADYDILERSGRFDIDSTLEKNRLARNWFGFESPDQLLFGGSQSIAAAGTFRVPPGGTTPEIRATGRIACESVMVKGVVFDQFRSAFALRDGEVLLRDTRVERPDGAAWGKAHIQWPLVRIALEATLPAPVYKPLFVGQPLEQVIDSFTTNERSTTHVVIEGGFDATDRYSWAYQGHGKVEHSAYNDVPVISAAAKFSVSHRELDFRDGELVLDARRDPQRLAYGGPAQTHVNVGAIRYIHQERLLEIDDVRGETWVPAVLALFNAGLAEDLSQYQFHRPPSLTAGGTIDLTPAGRTRFDIRFGSSSPATTNVLGENLTFSRAAGRVLLRGPRVEVRDLRLAAFDGPVRATIIHDNKKLSAEIAWTRVNLPALAGAYGVTMQGGGTTTGRVEFSIRDGKTSTLNGDGNAGFEEAHLFAVPMLGPLSPLIATIVDDASSSYERAKNAFLTFEIKDGVVRSNNFNTTTTSLNFTGDGAIDLNDSTVNITMRVNARGLLGLITLPLRPFYGLFQFHGTGPMREPVWESVMFTSPPDHQRQNLLTPPKARVVDEP